MKKSGKLKDRTKDREARRVYWAENPAARARQRVRAAAGRALKAGKIQRPDGCERCGSSRMQMHHFDYAKPLDVHWFCPPCHRFIHQIMREAGVKAGAPDADLMRQEMERQGRY